MVSGSQLIIFLRLTFQLSVTLVTTLLFMALNHALNVLWTLIRTMNRELNVTHAQLEHIRLAPEVRHWKTACVSISLTKLGSFKSRPK